MGADPRRLERVLSDQPKLRAKHAPPHCSRKALGCAGGFVLDCKLTGI
jgi:hypothetical protein